jgi:hypothetical protein
MSLDEIPFDTIQSITEPITLDEFIVFYLELVKHLDAMIKEFRRGLQLRPGF